MVLVKSKAVAGTGFTGALRSKAHSSQKGLGLGVLMPPCPETRRTADFCTGALSSSPGCLNSALWLGSSQTALKVS